jgi:hypothetical protein
VSPTATGNGIEGDATKEFEVALELPEPVRAPATLEAGPLEAPLDVPTPMLTSG